MDNILLANSKCPLEILNERINNRLFHTTRYNIPLIVNCNCK